LQAMMDRLALENEEVDGDAPEDDWAACCSRMKHYKVYLLILQVSLDLRLVKVWRTTFAKKF
jgi:hypothetical protein